MSKKKDSSNKLSKDFLSLIDNLLFKYRYIIFIFLFGIILVLVGVLIFNNSFFGKSNIEIIDNKESSNSTSEIVVEIAGEVIKPGVYKLTNGSRMEDILVLSGGINENADREWIEKNINRAAILSDGQKVYIPNLNEQSKVLSANGGGIYQNTSLNFGSQGSGFVDINAATQKELESLNGIGPVYAQNIIEYRPYSIVEEIVTKAKIPQKTFEKIKDQIIVY